jgi:hypothetical protein
MDLLRNPKWNREKPTTVLLVRFGEKEHLERFRFSGEMFIRPIEFYAKYEDEGELRGDPNEGTDQIFQPGRVERMTVEGAGEKFVLESDQLVGPVRLNMGIAPRVNIFCLSAIKPPFQSPVLDPRNQEFGEFMVLIKNIQGFIDRVKLGLRKMGLKCNFDLVEYLDGENHSGDTGVFRKSDAFEYQSEFRFAVYPGFDADKPVQIGSLEDITSEIMLSKKIESIRLEPYDES